MAGKRHVRSALTGPVLLPDDGSRCPSRWPSRHPQERQGPLAAGAPALSTPPWPPPQSPSQPAQASGPLLGSISEPAQPARLGITVKQPPPVRLTSIIGLVRVGVVIGHRILPPPLKERRPPAWRLDASGGRRIQAPPPPFGGSDGDGTRPTSYLARRNPSIPATDRHSSSFRDEAQHGQGESGPADHPGGT